MGRLLLTILLVVLGAGLLLWLTLVTIMRTKFQPGLDAIRRLNKKVTNPRALRSAGNVDGYSVIRHVGRRSGRPYATPIGVVEVADGFLIGLPYGTRADWLQNVLAAGRAELAHEGRIVPVGDPELLTPDEVSPHFSGRSRLVNRLYGIEDFLRLIPVEAAEVVDRRQ